MKRHTLSFLRKCARYALVASLLPLLSSGVAHAVPIVPGAVQFPAVAEPDPVGANLVFSTGPVPFAAATFNGSLRSAVWNNDASNPFGANSLTFTYEITNNGGSADAIARLAVASFDGFLTDASYVAALGPTAPTFISRSANGAVMGFGFVAPGLNPGANSAILTVQTNATTFQNVMASLIDGSVTTVRSVAPVPEPATIAMFAIGALGLIGYARLRR